MFDPYDLPLVDIDTGGEYLTTDNVDQVAIYMFDHHGPDQISVRGKIHANVLGTEHRNIFTEDLLCVEMGIFQIDVPTVSCGPIVDELNISRSLS